MGNLSELQAKIEKWSEDRGILANSKASTQCLKLMSEMGELADNIAKGKDCRDDIGDCFVVLVNIAKLVGSNIEECAEIAYNDIKDRKGFLNEAGTFIKSTDANYEKLYQEFLQRNEIPRMKAELTEIEREELLKICETPKKVTVNEEYSVTPTSLKVDNFTASLPALSKNPTDAEIIAAWEARGFRAHKRKDGWFFSRVH